MAQSHLLSTSSTSSSVPEWQHNVREGLHAVLGSKITAKQRNPAFVLTRVMMDVCGQQWAVKAEAQVCSISLLSLLLHSSQSCFFVSRVLTFSALLLSLQNPGKFVELLMALVGVEVRMILDSEPDWNHDILTLLSECYLILEHTITFLTSGSDEENESTQGAPSSPLLWCNLPSSVLQNVQKMLSQSFATIIEYLALCRVRML